MEYEKTLKTINIAPTWAATADMLISILESGTTAESLAYAKLEIRRMGQIIDRLQERYERIVEVAEESVDAGH